jgi:hypothetical protein
MKIWRYVIVNNAGAAPNYGPPLTTLAICKPMIRKGAKPGEMIIAFAGKPILSDPNRVVWAGVVREKLTFEEYWRDPRFAKKKPKATSRPDNFYRPKNGRLIQVPNDVHDGHGMTTDLRGQFVLVMDPAWRLDLQLSSLPDQFSSLLLSRNNRRGHRVSEISQPLARELQAWFESRVLEKASVDLIGGACVPSVRRFAIA